MEVTVSGRTAVISCLGYRNSTQYYLPLRHTRASSWTTHELWRQPSMFRLDAQRPATFCDGLSRRDFLHAAALAPLGLTLPRFLAAKPQAADADVNCIMLFLVGGPSHID